MRNLIQIGDTITTPAPALIASGDVVIIGELHGIAAGDAAPGDDFDLVTTGVFELPKVAAVSIAVGDALYWDATAKLITTTDTDNTRIGTAVTEAVAMSGSVKVKLI